MVWDFGGLRFGSSQVDILLVYYAALANNQNQYTCFGHASEYYTKKISSILHSLNGEHFMLRTTLASGINTKALDY